MKLVDTSITKDELRRMAQASFGNLVKAVVDVSEGVMVVDTSLHADGEACLLEKGSQQTDLWGINLYPDLEGDDFIEFDSMINLRPNQGNMSRGIDNPETQKRVRRIIAGLIKK